MPYDQLSKCWKQKRVQFDPRKSLRDILTGGDIVKSPTTPFHQDQGCDSAMLWK